MYYVHTSIKQDKNMKLKYFIPLSLPLIIVKYFFLWKIPKSLMYQIPFICLWVFYVSVYYSGLKNTLLNKDPVIKIGTITYVKK